MWRFDGRFSLFGPALLAVLIGATGACSTTESPDDDEEICNDGVDNDGDGATDCDDSECAGAFSCDVDVEVCDNSVDDDGDAAVDCDDADCAADPACAGSVEVCNDTVDNDGDSAIDCDDSDCAADPACTGGACLADADYGAATVSNQLVDDGLPDGLVVGGELNADADLLVVELYAGFGAMSGGIVPGTYALAGDDLNYATCGLCLRLFSEDTEDAGYFATGGTVTITSVSPNAVIDVSNATFEHVEVDPTTFESTPHADGCTSAITSASFDTPVGTEICDNMMDDDGDTDVDCDDADCAADPACAGPVEICDNMMDDDGDTDVDCDDADCADDPACTVCLADADYGAATLANQSIAFNGGTFIGVTGELNVDVDELVLELYDNAGAFSGGVVAPGTYTITGDELNYATCGVCVRLFTEDVADDGYLATGGTVTITELSPNVVATLSDLTFEHVTIDATTFESTPAEDGCTTSVTSVAFDVSTAELCEGEIDEDGDGDVDCDDSDCAADPACTAPTCTAEADYGAATLLNQVAEDALPTAIAGAGELNADPDLIQVELYNGFGVFAGGIAPGTYTLAGDELNYSTCGACVRLFTETDDDYFATGGTITVTQVTPDLVVDIADVTFEHVDIDATTFVSTPHADGCLSAVTSASLDVTPTP